MITRRDAIIGRAFGIGAALAYGSSSVLIRQGVTGLAPPLVGAAIGLLSGTLSLTIVGARGLRTNLTQKRRAIGFLLIAGVTAALGIMSSFFALSMAPVVIVSPLQSTSPLFTLLWSHLFLGKLEKITLRLVLGSILVISGVALITIGRVG
jgi:drug/metabolite transporter (DMT)-like permease